MRTMIESESAFRVTPNYLFNRPEVHRGDLATLKAQNAFQTFTRLHVDVCQAHDTQISSRPRARNGHRSASESVPFMQACEDNYNTHLDLDALLSFAACGYTYLYNGLIKSGVQSQQVMYRHAKNYSILITLQCNELPTQISISHLLLQSSPKHILQLFKVNGLQTTCHH